MADTGASARGGKGWVCVFIGKKGAAGVTPSFLFTIERERDSIRSGAAREGQPQPGQLVPPFIARGKKNGPPLGRPA